MTEPIKTGKPQYKNIGLADIARYRMPLAAILSILHRVSGALMFLLLPLMLLLLDKSLMSEISFEYFKGIVSHWFIKLLLLGLIWAYLHHICAGIRFLLLDVHVGLDKDKARRSSVAVFAVSLPLTLLFALKLFGAF
ncbi:succinate dehydrogenase, cytochrome b556 subunit [Oxalicibacterium solurbis]|uniref:Succinate dehydrogenase cytochrome b556 subunit n=1 Tax=Oxalicibacterium solurbis TaxID=69280 RepID=A0A8J3B0U9_9BURK|nr:succinate dehydrogenase, cytochrome b556 subunit [Oxalicibacterium solurbis]GGI52973.1 succinate dehydrogenase cytochrome b-556 subunit [Oxalicibacterium solurbis]